MTKPSRPSRDQVTALAERAAAITAAANDLLADAMREALDGAGGLSGVAAETARDVAQYMTRRGIAGDLASLTRSEANETDRTDGGHDPRDRRLLPPNECGPL